MSKAEQFYDLIMRTGSLPPADGDLMAAHPSLVEAMEFINAHEDGAIFLRGLACIGGYAASAFLKTQGRSLTEVAIQAELMAAQMGDREE